MKEYTTMWHVWPGYRDDYRFTAPVAQFQANDLGLFDMEGNLSEWIWDGGLKGGSWMEDEAGMSIEHTNWYAEKSFPMTNTGLRMAANN